MAQSLSVRSEYFRVIFLVPEWPGDHLFFGSFETWQPPPHIFCQLGTHKEGQGSAFPGLYIDHQWPAQNKLQDDPELESPVLSQSSLLLAVRPLKAEADHEKKQVQYRLSRTQISAYRVEIKLITDLV